ncbi:GNAT family N-acetyltransferase [Ectothiorhodospira marina]|uniref:GNAT family N-acetyltransferase n=1 Tax=Ectothiorhodospira marina TaxID=1396821 RepID=UPI0015A4F74F|nr:GNAT family N-acetyltransferase [Ectothiorhodospira marina]
MERAGLLLGEVEAHEAWGAALKGLLQGGDDWDELHVRWVPLTQVQAMREAAGRLGLKTCVWAQQPNYRMKLGGVEGGLESYLQTLSRNTRYQVRRSIRLYRELGDLTVHPAHDESTAVEYFEALVSLHERHWRRRGREGAFGGHFMYEFHRRYVRAAWARGDVQLLRISAGSRCIGYLYNMVYRGVVSNYQCGFCYPEDPRFKPGLVSHALAIAHNAALGMQVYDFLLGDARYKRTLANDCEEQFWVVFQKPRWWLQVVDRLQARLHLIKGR